MKHIEVKEHQRLIKILIDYLIERQEDNFHLMYGLDKNNTRINNAVFEINKNVNKTLVEIENKVFDARQAKLDELEKAAGRKFTDDEKEKAYPFDQALKTLPETDQKKHQELFAKYLEDMEAENDLQLFMLDPLKLEHVKIGFEYMQILSMFLPKE